MKKHPILIAVPLVVGLTACSSDTNHNFEESKDRLLPVQSALLPRWIRTSPHIQSMPQVPASFGTTIAARAFSQLSHQLVPQLLVFLEQEAMLVDALVPLHRPVLQVRATLEATTTAVASAVAALVAANLLQVRMTRLQLLKKVRDRAFRFSMLGMAPGPGGL